MTLKSATANTADLFTALDNYLKTQRKKFGEVSACEWVGWEGGWGGDGKR